MKRLLASAAVVAVLATTSAAFAEPQQATGKVKTYDATKQELGLGGKKNADIVFYVPPAAAIPGLQPGVRVTITWEMVNGKHTASTVVLKPKKAKPAKPAKPETN